MMKNIRIEQAKQTLERNYKEALFKTRAGQVSKYYNYTDEDKHDLVEMYRANPDGVLDALLSQCEYINNVNR